MFLGLEFPTADTRIVDGIGFIRYYSGKTFETFNAEKRLNQNGSFIIWPGVVGAARSNDIDIIQADLFAYIDTIKTPTKLRTQFNSWYDWMMDITESNICESFWEIERGLSSNGIPPLDSYVVDDGWNAYGPYEKDNTTGFW